MIIEDIFGKGTWLGPKIASGPIASWRSGKILPGNRRFFEPSGGYGPKTMMASCAAQQIIAGMWGARSVGLCFALADAPMRRTMACMPLYGRPVF